MQSGLLSSWIVIPFSCPPFIVYLQVCVLKILLLLVNCERSDDCCRGVGSTVTHHIAYYLLTTQYPQSQTMSLPPTTFGDASVIEALGQHEYRINVHPDFSWGSVAHGGYLFSLLWKVIALHYRTTLQKYDQPDTVAMHLELLRPAPLGEAKVVVKDTRLGKGSSTVHVALVQGGKERVVGYAT